MVLFPAPALPVSSLAAVTAALRDAGCVYGDDEARLLLAASTDPNELRGLLDRRVSGIPLEQVLGWAEFCGLRVPVAPGVFVPRLRTQLLALEAARRAAPGSVVVDLCCGSGAVALAVSSLVPGVELWATDIDPIAVDCARRNLAAVGSVLAGDLYEPLPGRLCGLVDVLVANAPYVPTADIALLPHEARDHEPPLAFDGGVDGLALHRRLAGGALKWLAPGGHLLVETSDRQAPLTAALFESLGLAVEVQRDDEFDATVAVGTRVPDPGRQGRAS